MERLKTTGYLEPEGNYTHMAALKDQKARNYSCDLLYGYKSIEACYAALDSGEVNYVVVPYKNWYDGEVGNMMEDLLRNGSRRHFLAKYAVPIAHCGYYLPDHPVVRAKSKDTALNQCRRRILEEFGEIELIPTNSTGEAVQIAAEEPGTLAIASEISAKVQGLESELVIVPGMADNRFNTTTFVLESNKPEKIDPTGDDETTFFIQVEDRPGGLLEGLSPISEKGIDLSEIKSLRRNGPWISFLASIKGHREDLIVKEMFSDLHRLGVPTWILGSYPRLVYPEMDIGLMDMELAKDRARVEASLGADKGIDQIVAVVTLENAPGSLVRLLRSISHRDLTTFDSTVSGLPGPAVFYVGLRNNVDLDMLSEELNRGGCQRILLLDRDQDHYIK